METKAHPNGANRLDGAAQAEHPAIMSATFSRFPHAPDALQEFSQRFDFGVVAPREIPGDFGIAGISGERRLGETRAERPAARVERQRARDELAVLLDRA